MERWANGVGKDEGFEVDVEVEERDFLLDPHMWCVFAGVKGKGSRPSERRRMLIQRAHLPR